MKAVKGKYSGIVGVEVEFVGWDVVGVAVKFVVVGFDVGVGVGVGVSSGGLGGSCRVNVVEGATEFTTSRIGVKLTMSKFKSHLKS
jgi:hypothetical protein